MKNTSLQKACDVLGGQTALAIAIGVKPPTVNQWITGDRPIPPLRCVQIEKAVNSKITRKELRSDWKNLWPELLEEAA